MHLPPSPQIRCLCLVINVFIFILFLSFFFFGLGVLLTLGTPLTVCCLEPPIYKQKLVKTISKVMHCIGWNFDKKNMPHTQTHAYAQTHTRTQTKDDLVEV